MTFSRKFSDFLFFLFIIIASYSKTGVSTPIEAVHSNPNSAFIELIANQQAQPHLQLEAKGAPLGKILNEVANKTGVLIHYSKLSDVPISATCQGENVNQIMTCLVSKQISMIAKPPEKNKPAEFWLVGTCEQNCEAVADVSAQATSPEQTEPNQDQSEMLLEQYKNAKTTSERAIVLNNFTSGANIENPNVRMALEEAMTDKDVGVRAQALTTMAYLDKDHANEHLSRALLDQSSDVRMTAVDKADGNTEILEQALGDKDTGISSFAAAKLDEIRRRELRYPKNQ